MFQTKNSKSSHHSSSLNAEKGNNPFISPKLNIGKPGDKYELEADNVADKIIANEKNSSIDTPFFAPSLTIQKQTDEETESGVQQKPLIEKNSTVQPTLPNKNQDQKKDDEQDEIQTQPEENLLKKETEKTIQEKPESAVFTPETQNKAEEDIQEKEEEEFEEPVQEKRFLQKNEEPETGNGKNNTGTSLESQLNASKGSGTPLNENVQSQMESGFGSDFSGVRIHTDSTSAQMNKELGAQAFTHGNDIYFNEGKYNPESNSGKHLLAHELTHTVQQGASLQTKMIQKVDEENTDSSGPEMELATGILNEAAETITFNEIPIPGFKLLAHRGTLYSSKAPLKRKKNYLRGNTNQRDGVWKPGISTNIISQQLTEIYRNHHHVEPDNTTTHVFKANIAGRNVKPTYIGTLATILPEITAPVWGKNNEFRSFDVDHIVELQLANWNEEAWPNTMDNMELLDSSKNSSSGSSIKNAIDTKVELFRERHGEQHAGSAGHLKNTYTMVFNNAVGSAGGASAISENEFWTKNQIEAGEHLGPIEAGNLAEIGGEGEVRIFPNATGGLGKRFRWTGADDQVHSDEANWLGNPFKIVSKQFSTEGEGVENTANLGTISVNIPENDKTWQPWAENKVFNVIRFPGSKYAGYVTKQSIKSGLYGLRVKKASPVDIITLELMPNGLSVYGQINPSIPIFSGNPIEFTLSNGEFIVSKTFPLDQINVPAPFEISDTSLTIFASTQNGLGLSGQTNFAINQVGEGHIEATASTTGGLELEGAFNFDSELFEPAEINVEYKDNIWTIGGEIGIPEGKVRGIKSATITASYSENNFTASGNAELDIPGIERGTLTVNYGNEGFSIGGNFDLSSDIPGIRSGNVEARVSKEEGAENYNVFVSGTAQPDIPGIDTTLNVTYDNGALTIEGRAAYNRGMLSGNINIGATNRNIDENGQPTGDPNDTMRVYGGGDLTLQLTPWLEATAGVQFLPNGEIEVSGRIALPSTVDVFDRREFRRNLFTVPTIEIPLFAIPLGPRSLGLVAQISGGLDFSAGFGPGQLREVFAEVTYNPDREEETEIRGHGEFAIPADAGLTLRGDLGLGLSIAIASLSGGIELAGTLGLEGEAAAEVDLSWSPQTGIVLDAEGRITVNPKFTFDVNAFARASLGIGWFSISETWRHNLVSFSWGPDIQFGIVFPVHYQEDQPFDISFDDIEVIYPDLDVIDMAKNLARDIKDDIFD